MALSFIVTLLSFTGTMASDITHCDGFSENNTCSQTCFQLPCTMRCGLSSTKHDKCEQNCVTATCDLMECKASESCEQFCVGRTCNSMVCHADVCSQDCTAGKCDTICSSSVKDCQQSCIAGNCNFKCDAKNCKLDCFPGTCSELKSSTDAPTTVQGADNQKTDSPTTVQGTDNQKTDSPTTVQGADNQKTESETSQSDLHMKIIYGLVGLLVVSIIFLACWVVFKRWRHRERAQQNEVPIPNQPGLRVYEGIPMHPVAKDQTREVPKDNEAGGIKFHHEITKYIDIPIQPVSKDQNYDDISESFELDRDQIKLVRLLGTGNFGQVSKGTYGASRLDVAVKSLKDNAEQTDIRDMLTEADVMKSLQPHPHIVRLIGYCIEKVPLLIVLEYLPYGDLLGYLRKSRGHEDKYNSGEKRPNSRLTEKDLLSFAWMIADGMSYLATMKVVHRDLAARNILVGENKVCKISDFGLARGLEGDIYTRRSQARLPAKWMPPESLFSDESSTMSDVWSYGIVMWEVFTIGESPYPGIPARQVAGLLQTGYRMPRPRHLSEELYAIMTECWEEQPQKRPTFKWLCSAVRRLLDDQKMYLDLDKYDDQEYVNFDMKIDE